MFKKFTDREYLPKKCAKVGKSYRSGNLSQPGTGSIKDAGIFQVSNCGIDELAGVACVLPKIL